MLGRFVSAVSANSVFRPSTFEKFKIFSNTNTNFAQRNMAPVAKRRKVEQVEEITFNPEARQEYLTGFHKRKLQRIENARDAAAKREKEERVKARKEVRRLNDRKLYSLTNYTAPRAKERRLEQTCC